MMVASFNFYNFLMKSRDFNRVLHVKEELICNWKNTDVWTNDLLPTRVNSKQTREPKKKNVTLYVKMP